MTPQDVSVLCEAIVEALPLGVVIVSDREGLAFVNRAGCSFLEGPDVRVEGKPIAPSVFLCMEWKKVEDTPIATHSAEVDGEQVAIGSIADEGLGCRIFLIQGKAELDGRMIAALYGLRPSEGRVAATLINTGLSQGATGDNLSISYENIRTHIKHIYSKMRVNTQHALTATILNGPAALMERMR